MNERISYLLKAFADKEVAITTAARIIGLPKKEAMEQVRPFTEYMDQEKIYVRNVRPFEWAEQVSGISHAEIVYTEKERRALIYLLVYSKAETLSVFHFQDFLKVSKGTILTDIKKIRQEIASEELHLDYTRRSGFVLKGSEFALRRKAKNLVAHLMQTRNGRFGLAFWTATIALDCYAETREILGLALDGSDLQFAPNRVDELAYFLAMTKKRIATIPLEEIENPALLASLNVSALSRSVLTPLMEEKLSETEILFFALCLATVVQGDIRDSSLDFLLDRSSEVIHRMESLMAVEFESFRELLTNFFYHLVPAYFRISYSFDLPNVMITQIKQQYASIFELTKKALLPLEECIGKSIPEEEVGYFTILFGGEIRKAQSQTTQKKVKAIIVCPSGVSSSVILKNELQQLFPTILFTETNSVDRLHEIEETSYDIIFSTVPITLSDQRKSLYLLRPIMSDLEKNRLINQVQRDWLIPGFSLPPANELVKALLPYIEFKEGVDEQKLYQVLNRKMNKLLEKKEDCRPMLSELLSEEMIQLTDHLPNWEEAITKAAQPLLLTYKIEESYVQAMIERVKQYGAFIHIGDHIALPHARPEDGVKEVGMSLLKLNEPVDLADDPKHPISLFICLAAIDNEAHLRALANLTRLLSRKENLQALLAAQNKQEILEIIKKGDE
ncbi:MULTISPECIES: BglG family transcription antiterminator [unclassified Enterococcus]|uniref:BglG family transcription antiterminator n=1 Tax=unclassified Enterococcus TaxID=2608891 RepID=UPI0013ED32E6|nr:MULTISPECIES: BglG family transcription antiterminator [unclassified Enterococcus]